MSDIEIARKAKKKNIKEIASKLDLKEEDLRPYGHHIAKIDSNSLKSLSENKSISRYLPKLDQPKTLFKLEEKKPILPSTKELRENLPSRSAKLRYAIKKKNFYEFKTDILEKFEHLIKIENFGNKL